MSKIFSQLSTRRTKSATSNGQLELLFDAPVTPPAPPATGPVQPDLSIQVKPEEPPVTDPIALTSPDSDNEAPPPPPPSSEEEDTVPIPAETVASEPDQESARPSPELVATPVSVAMPEPLVETPVVQPPAEISTESKIDEAPAPAKTKRDTFSAKSKRREEELNQQIEALRKEKESLFGQLEETRKTLEASRDARKSGESKLHLDSIRTTQRVAAAPLRAPLSAAAVHSAKPQPPASPTPVTQPTIPPAKAEPPKRHLSVGHPESFSETGRFPPFAIISMAVLIGVLLIGAAAIIPLMNAPPPSGKIAAAAIPAQPIAKPAPKPAPLTPASAPAANPQARALPATNTTPIAARQTAPAALTTNAPAPKPDMPPAATPKPPAAVIAQAPQSAVRTTDFPASKLDALPATIIPKPAPVPPPPPAWPNIAIPGVSVTTNANELLVVFAETLFRKRADLSDEGKKLLIEVAGACASQAATFQFVIQGHTDPGQVSSGAFADNRALGQARADAALALLRDQARIPAANLKAISKGESDPPYSNTTPEMRRRNRTVTIRIIRP